MTIDRLLMRLRIRPGNESGPTPIEPIAGCYHCDAEWNGQDAGRCAREHAKATGHDTWRLTGHWDICCGSEETTTWGAPVLTERSTADATTC